MESSRIIEIAKSVFETELEGVKSVLNKLGDSFVQAVKTIKECKGKVVITGLGKSGIVGKKIAATLASTGTPAFFLHAAEGAHGDLGMVGKGDVAIAISNSGETSEVLQLIPTFKRLGVTLIAFVGRVDSSLAKAADIVIDVSVPKEACPLGLAPTASSTAIMVLGDALAITLLELNGFTAEKFALFHPAGSLGKKLLLKVKDLMHSGDEVPRVKPNSPMSEVVLEMSEKRLGMTCVDDDEGRVVGIITDGDLRRGLQKYRDLFSREAKDVMTVNPKMIDKEALAIDGLNKMEKYSITSLLVYDAEDPTRCVGVLHIHDIMKAGLA